jgi:hypothetical protein
MALTSTSTLTDALSQYKNSLAWWESAIKASSLLEAVLYLLACKPETIAAADQSVSFASLESLRGTLEKQVVNLGSAAQRVSFTSGKMLM